MSRPSTALRQWDVPGRAGQPVRLHRPGRGRDGTLKASWRVTYYDSAGRLRETTAIGESAATAKAEALVVQLAATVTAPSSDSPLRDVLELYMTSVADKKSWSPTYRQERAYTVRWLPPWFLALSAREWTVQASERILRAVADAGSPRGTQEYRRVGALLSGLRTTARQYQYLPSHADPMVGIAYNTSARQRHARPDLKPEKFGNVRPVLDSEIPTDEQIDELADVVEWLTGDWREALRVRLLRASGLRWGEHADCRVGQVSLDDPYVLVCRQAVEVRKRFSPTGETLLRDQPPKGGRDRHALYDDAIGDVLERRIREIQRASCTSADAELLLPTRGGSVLREGNYLNRVWGPAAAACGWPRVEDGPHAPGGKKSGWLWTPHSLRHRYATWLVREVKADLYDVSEWMGHTDTAITRRMYVSHTIPNVHAGARAVAEWRSTQEAAPSP